MGTLTMTYGAASLWAALAAACLAMLQRFGVSPIPATQGTSVPAAAALKARNSAVTPLSLAHVVARKADDRFRPRGRRL